MSAPASLTMATKWSREFQKAIELDGWGQVEEARTSYDSIARSMQDEAKTSTAEGWSKKQTAAVWNLSTCLRLRSMVIKRDDDEGISAENMKALVGIFEALFKRDKKFPLDLTTVSPEDLCEASGEAQLPGPGGDASDEEILEEVTAAAPRRAAPAHATVASKHAQIGLRRQESRRREALRAEEAHVGAGAAAHQYEEAPGQGPPPQAHVATPTAMPVFAQKRSVKAVYITVKKIGLKDWEVYNEPRVAVYFVSGGRIHDQVQDTKVSKEREQQHIIFNETIRLKQTLDQLLPGGAVFFEFKHYKKDKQRISTRCWCFLDREDLKEGDHVLELYKKPADLRQKKLSLFTIKELYLHINVEFVSEDA